MGNTIPQVSIEHAPPRTPLLDTHEAANYLGIPRQTLAVWRSRHNNSGPAYVKVGRHVNYRRADLDAYIDINRVVPAGRA